MIRLLDSFAGRFSTTIDLDENLIVDRGGRRFLLNEDLRHFVSEDAFYAGTYLGRVKDGRFSPSFNLLRIIAERKANKVIVNRKTEWLFICGRDVFRSGITDIVGSKRKGDYVLVLNRHHECLGYGEILHNLDANTKGVAVRNILDIGDFLRREK
jgi:ribosome biogenesis protein Nip4